MPTVCELAMPRSKRAVKIPKASKINRGSPTLCCKMLTLFIASTIRPKGKRVNKRVVHDFSARKNLRYQMRLNELNRTRNPASPSLTQNSISTGLFPLFPSAVQDLLAAA
jgi:hypothetical protein